MRLVVVEVEGRKGGAADDIDTDGTVCRLCLVREGRYAGESLHQEDKEGGWTRREYIEVNGTEKAYDSGLDVGKSIKTPSVWCRG